MSDWIGLAFFVLLILGAIFALKALAQPRPRTSEEFEKSAAQNTTLIGSFMNALHDVTDPGAERAREVRMQMKDGRYMKKKREGKANDDEPDDVEKGS
jgi:hypothetical protein